MNSLGHHSKPINKLILVDSKQPWNVVSIGSYTGKARNDQPNPTCSKLLQEIDKLDS